MNKQNKTGQIVFLLTGKILSLLLTFLIPVILTRVLTKSEYGCYASFNTTTLFVVSLATLGFPHAIYYFIPKGTIADLSIVWYLFGILLVCGCLFAGLVMFPPIQELVIGESQIKEYILYICIYIILFLPTEMVDPLTVVTQSNYVALIYPSFTTICKVCGVLLGICFNHSLTGILIGVVAGQGVVSIMAFGFYCWKTACQCITHFSFLKFFLKIKEIFKFSLPFGVASILFTLATRFDKIVCIKYLSEEDYASYAIAFLGIPGIRQLSDSLGNVYLVEMTKAWTSDDKKKVIESLHAISAKMLSVLIPLIFIVLIYSKQIIVFVYTEKYVSSTLFFQLYLISFLFSTIGAGLAIRARGNTTYTMIAYLISCAITLPATVFLVKHFGAIGGITGALLGVSIPRCIQMGIECHMLKITLMQYLPWRKVLMIIACSITFLIPCYAIEILQHPSIVIVIGLSFLYCVCVFCCEIRYDVFFITRNEIENFLIKKHLTGYIPNIFQKFLLLFRK